MGFTSAGLPAGGRTAHFSVEYDTALPNGLALARGMLRTGESDYQEMAEWFGGIGLIFDLPIPVQITNDAGGASWSDPPNWVAGLISPTITIHSLDPDSMLTDLTRLRYLRVSEVTEMFMASQQHGWFGSATFTGADEGSKGEALSRFLALKFLTGNGLATSTPNRFDVTDSWLNSQRPNYVDHNPDDINPDVVTGCTTLFLFYLHHQLGFTVEQIVAAGADTLAGVYRNLTGRTDGWVSFRRLVDAHYPVGVEYYPPAETVFPVSEMTAMFSPGGVVCGYSGTSTIFVDRPPVVDLPVRLSSDDPSSAGVPPTVTIPAGALSAEFTVTTTAVAGPFPPKTVALHARYGNRALSTTIQILPPRLGSMTIAPDTVAAGQGATGTVRLSRPSLAGDVVVNLLSVSPGFATVPPTVTIREHDLQATFLISTPAIQIPFTTARADIQASYAGSFADAVLTVTPTVVAGSLATLTLNPALVTGGESSRGTVTLQHPVPTDTLVGLAASDGGAGRPPLPGDGSTVVTVPDSITILAGQTRASFPIRTSSVGRGSRRSVTIMAGAVVTKYARLTIVD